MDREDSAKLNRQRRRALIRAALLLLVLLLAAAIPVSAWLAGRQKIAAAGRSILFVYFAQNCPVLVLHIVNLPIIEICTAQVQYIDKNTAAAYIKEFGGIYHVKNK